MKILWKIASHPATKPVDSTSPNFQDWTDHVERPVSANSSQMVDTLLFPIEIIDSRNQAKENISRNHTHTEG